MTIEAAADRAALLADFGEVMSWTVAPAGAVSVNGLANHGTVRTDLGDGPDLLNRLATMLVPDADIPSGGRRGDAAVFRGLSCTIKSVEPDGTGFSVVRLEQVVASQAAVDEEDP